MYIDPRKMFGIGLVVLALSVSATMLGVSHLQVRKPHRVPVDSLTLGTDNRELGIRSKMGTSVYPVEMTVNRRTIRIRSEHNQLLPVYRQNGSFYMVVRLNKGVNWLNGLPRGRYFINNKPILIK